jgi:O-antigen/teichoic acid export membrane protein
MNKILAFAIGPVAGALLGIISLPIMAWYFSAEDIGRLSMLQVMISFCVLLFSLGLDQSYVREYHESSNKPLTLKLALLPGTVIFLVSSLIFFSIKPYWLSELLFSIKSFEYSLIIVLAVFSSFISRFLSLILRMKEKGVGFSMSQVLPKIIFVCIILVYILYDLEKDFELLLLAHVISIIAVLSVLFWNTRADWVPSIWQRIDRKKIKEMLLFGTPLVFGGLASWALMAMDKIALKNLSTLSELGIYSIAMSIASATAIMGAIFNILWAPTVYKWVAEGKNLKKVDEISEYVQICILIIFVIVGSLSWLVPLVLPSHYSSVQYILPLVIASPLLYTLSETTSIGINLKKKTSFSMFASILAALCNLIGNYMLVPLYGAVGAAISTAISMWIFFVLRTEFSSFLWKRVGDWKVYASTSICIMTSLCTVTSDLAIALSLWGGVLCFGIYIYHSAIFNIIKLIKNHCYNCRKSS